MPGPLKPAANGLTAPPFIARSNNGNGRGGWWSSLDRRGKLTTYAALVLAIAMVVVLVISAGAGNGATRVERQTRHKAEVGALGTVARGITKNLEALRLSIVSYRLKLILGKVTATAPELEKKLSELSRVVQGGRSSVLIARADQLSDVPLETSDSDIPETPEGVWRYANNLADSYLPRFGAFIQEIKSARQELVVIGASPELQKSNDLLLRSCDLQLKASAQCTRGLEFIKDCNEMTVGEASELISSAVSMVKEGGTCLQKAISALAHSR